MEQKRDRVLTILEQNSLFIDSHYTNLQFQGQRSDLEQYFIANQNQGQYTTKLWIFKYKDIISQPMALKNLIKEQYIFSQLNSHDNIIQIVDVIYDKNDDQSNNDVYLAYTIMDCCLEMINKQYFTLDHIKYNTYLMLRALAYIHSSGIIHCNIQPEAILLNKNDDHSLSQLQYALPANNSKNNQQQQNSYKYQTLNQYSAPEVLLRSTKISTSADLWSLGCIVLTYVLKKPIFTFTSSEEGLIEIIKIIGTPSFQDFCEAYQSTIEDQERVYKSFRKQEEIPFNQRFQRIDFKTSQLLANMLQFNPKKRWSADQLMQHTFFDQLYDSEDIILSKTQIDFDKIEQIIGEGRQKDFLHQLSKYYLLKQQSKQEAPFIFE